MSPVETVMQSNRKKIIIGAGIVAGGLWILLVMYLLAESKKDYSVAQPGVVAVHAPSPVGGSSSPSATFRSSRLFTPQVQYSVPTYQWSFVEQAPMTSTSMHLYQTSSATVHHVDGGGAGVGIALTSGGNNGGRGNRSSSISYGGSLLALSSSVALASPGAREATSLASTTEESASQNRPGRIKTTNSDPLDPFLDPIGDIAWPLMLLLTIGWCVRLRLRKQQ